MTETSTQEKIRVLRNHGFIVGERDPKMNMKFEGKFMVAEPYDPGHSQPDGSGGTWCIVGDDLPELVDIAFNFCSDIFPGGLGND